MNYFIIINGTQLLNAIEYIEEKQFERNRNILILACVSNLVWNDLINVLNQNNLWSAIITLYPQWMLKINRFTLFRSLTIFYAKFKLNYSVSADAQRIVLGNYKNIYCKYVAKKNEGSELIIVDDGPSTLDLFNNYEQKSSKSGTWIEYVLGLKEYKIQPDVIFSRYHKQILSYCINNKIKLIKNEFNFLKKNNFKKNDSGETLFIGYPLVEENVLSMNEYLNLLTNIKKIIGEYIYIPHRRESNKNLIKISQITIVKHLGLPFELYLYNSKCFPSTVVGFFSTIFFNVNSMFGDKIKLKYIRLNNLKIGHINDSDFLYKEIAEVADMIFSYDIKNIEP